MCVSVPKDFFLGLISYTFYVTVSLFLFILRSRITRPSHKWLRKTIIVVSNYTHDASYPRDMIAQIIKIVYPILC